MNQKFTQLRNNDLIVSQTIKDRMAMYQIDSYGQNEKIAPIGTLKLHYDLSRGHKSTILLIDDEKEFPYKLSKCLQGSLLLTVNDISVATRLLKDTMPDLIVVNMMTTGVSGFDFVRNVKRNKHTMQIPFVMLSANASTDEQIRGLKCGVNMYLPIPCELNYLSVVINSLLEQKQMLKEFYTTSASTYSYSYGTPYKCRRQELYCKSDRNRRPKYGRFRLQYQQIGRADGLEPPQFISEVWQRKVAIGQFVHP